jgi:tRNA/tmRNA/rRNA uracil-C5-methylase (TrmA/RlmC/RlmD family)
MRKRRNPLVFENILVTDTAAKGKTVGKAPDGRVIFINNAVPGDIVDVKTTKKRKAYFEGTAVAFHQNQKKGYHQHVNTLVFVAVVNGSTWGMSTKSLIRNKRF